MNVKVDEAFRLICGFQLNLSELAQEFTRIPPSLPLFKQITLPRIQTRPKLLHILFQRFPQNFPKAIPALIKQVVAETRVGARLLLNPRRPLPVSDVPTRLSQPTYTTLGVSHETLERCRVPSIKLNSRLSHCLLGILPRTKLVHSFRQGGRSSVGF